MFFHMLCLLLRYPDLVPELRARVSSLAKVLVLLRYSLLVASDTFKQGNVQIN